MVLAYFDGAFIVKSNAELPQKVPAYFDGVFIVEAGPEARLFAPLSCLLSCLPASMTSKLKGLTADK